MIEISMLTRTTSPALYASKSACKKLTGSTFSVHSGSRFAVGIQLRHGRSSTPTVYREKDSWGRLMTIRFGLAEFASCCALLIPLSIIYFNIPFIPLQMNSSVAWKRLNHLEKTIIPAIRITLCYPKCST
jgi:hypothetical protein